MVWVPELAGHPLLGSIAPRGVNPLQIVQYPDQTHPEPEPEPGPEPEPVTWSPEPVT